MTMCADVRRLRYLLDVVMHASHDCHGDETREPVQCQLCEALDEARATLGQPDEADA